MCKVYGPPGWEWYTRGMNHPPVTPASIDGAYCMHCGYALRGLMAEDLCPECATAVSRSLRGDLLRFCDPTYLRGLQRGTRIVFWSIVLSVAWAVFGDLLIEQLPKLATSDASVLQALRAMNHLIGVLCSICGVLGWWMLSAPDPAKADRDDSMTARRLVRISVIVTTLALLPRAAHDIATSSATTSVVFDSMGTLVNMLTLVALVTHAVSFFFEMLYIRSLAPRFPSPRLHQRANLYMWLLPLVFVVGMVVCIGPLVAIIMYLHLLSVLEKMFTRTIEMASEIAQTSDDTASTTDALT